MALGDSGRFQMVERTAFEKVLAELKLGLSDLYDPRNAAEFGKLVQAKGIVIGTISQRNDGYTISARVVDIETGLQVATAIATCNKAADLDAKYAQKVDGTIIDRRKVTGGTVTPFDQVKPFRAGGYSVERQQHTSIAGRLWDDAVSIADGMTTGGQCSAQYDLGKGYDLFECWLGVDDGRSGGMMGPGMMGGGGGMMGPRMMGGDQQVELVLKGDTGEFARFSAGPGDEARFISYPLTGVRSLVVSCTGDPILCNARFVKGRTTPSEPTDIYVGDGDVQYIQIPGEYRFHMGPRP